MRPIPIALAAYLAANLAALAGDAGAPAPVADAANPVAAIGLDKLSATGERPLFSPSRRPPPPVLAAAPPPPPPPAAPVEAKPAAPQRPPFTLLGAIIGESARIALLQENASQTTLRLREGESSQGWSVVEVDARSVLMRNGAGVATLDLPKPSQTAAPSLDADDPPNTAAPTPTAEADPPPPPPALRFLGNAPRPRFRR